MGKSHGLRHTNIYSKWSGIKRRCLNQNERSYKDYGGRGIKICDEWIDNFQAFYDYVSKLEHFGEKGYSLDRIDVNSNYEPNNLREISAEEPNLLNFKDVKIDSAFIKSNYKDKKGEMRPMYYLNRDAFFQVALGFTGKEASKLRWNFIQTFNAMEKTLKIRNK